MGFGKIKKEVEASGLDPQVAHADLTVDGRLVSGVVNVPDSVSVEQIEEFKTDWNKEELSDFSQVVLKAATKGIEEAVQDLRNKGIPIYGLDADGNLVTEEPVVAQEDVAETKENEEDVAYVQKLLFDNLKQIEEAEEVQESSKTDSKVKEKKAPTKKKPTKK